MTKCPLDRQHFPLVHHVVVLILLRRLTCTRMGTSIWKLYMVMTVLLLEVHIANKSTYWTENQNCRYSSRQTPCLDSFHPKANTFMVRLIWRSSPAKLYTSHVITVARLHSPIVHYKTGVHHIGTQEPWRALCHDGKKSSGLIVSGLVARRGYFIGHTLRPGHDNTRQRALWLCRNSPQLLSVPGMNGN